MHLSLTSLFIHICHFRLPPLDKVHGAQPSITDMDKSPDHPSRHI